MYICHKYVSLPGNEQGFHSQPVQVCFEVVVSIVLRPSLTPYLLTLVPLTQKVVPCDAEGFHRIFSSVCSNLKESSLTIHVAASYLGYQMAADFASSSVLIRTSSHKWTKSICVPSNFSIFFAMSD
jgi:hypothetical protein